MFRRFFQMPTDDAPDPSGQGASGHGRTSTSEPTLSALPIAGITRRRTAGLLGAILVAWVVILFARQVSEASAATSRAEAMITDNAQRQVEVAALEGELQRIQEPRYIAQQARAYGLGGPKEIAFTLAPDAPPLPADAPGSAAVRVGARPATSPIDTWLTLLFGPGG